MATYTSSSAGVEASICLRASSSSQSRISPCGIWSTSTFPLWNSATAVLGSEMMRALSESALGAPPQYDLFGAKSR